MTNGGQLADVARELFKSRFRGIYTKDTIPPLPNNSFVLVWLAGQDSYVGHWMAVYKRNNKLYEIDSYEEDRLGRTYKNHNIPDTDRQRAGEANCGQRTLTALLDIFPTFS